MRCASHGRLCTLALQLMDQQLARNGKTGLKNHVKGTTGHRHDNTAYSSIQNSWGLCRTNRLIAYELSVS